MITNFESITVELSEIELKMVDVVVSRFKQKPGRENLVTNQQMLTGLNKAFGLNLSEPRIRKIIQFIRINNILPGLIGISRGYYFTESVDEIESWIESMEERERSIAQSRMVAQNHVRLLRRNQNPEKYIVNPELF